MTRGSGTNNPLTGDNSLSADDLTRALKLAQNDKAVRAILLRIDSPGGSAVAAETIWAAIKHARDAGKPVIVSMGDVAGSGGYYIAAPADKIVAEPGTLTGSIGVIAGKLAFGEALKKFGGNWDSIQIGANAGMFSAMQPFTQGERARLEAVLDDIYGTFKKRVGDGRKLDAAAVEAVAKGRVWSGEDAKVRNLVDVLGGMSTALDLAKQAAGIEANQDVTLKLYPAPKSPYDVLVSRLTGGGNSSEDDAILPTQLLATLRLEAQRLALLLAPPGALVMKPLVVK
jgi:protease-4